MLQLCTRVTGDCTRFQPIRTRNFFTYIINNVKETFLELKRFHRKFIVLGDVKQILLPQFPISVFAHLKGPQDTPQYFRVLFSKVLVQYDT